jgi:hypothetical protein
MVEYAFLDMRSTGHPSILPRLHDPIMHDIVDNRTIIMQCSKQYPLLPILPPPLIPHTRIFLLLVLFVLPTRRGGDNPNPVKDLPKPSQAPVLLYLTRQNPLPLRDLLDLLARLVLRLKGTNLLVRVNIRPLGRQAREHGPRQSFFSDW